MQYDICQNGVQHSCRLHWISVFQNNLIMLQLQLTICRNISNVTVDRTHFIALLVSDQGYYKAGRHSVFSWY